VSAVLFLRIPVKPGRILSGTAILAMAAVAAGLLAPLSAAVRQSGARLVPASPALLSACHSTARVVGYPVPCPTRVPRGLVETGRGGPSPCVLHIIGPGGISGCAKAWRGWVVGSSTTPSEHLVLTASPEPLLNDAKLVNGPAWYPNARVRLISRVTINGWPIRAVYAPPETNDGSSFMNHVVLIWTVGGHTYGVGFHNVEGVHQTLLLDEQLVSHVRLVKP
jgi:hypothetical protein